MWQQLTRDDTPDGLVFSLGRALDEGSALAFIGGSHTRDARAAGGFSEQTRATIDYLEAVVHDVDPAAEFGKVRRYMTDSRGHRDPATREMWIELMGFPLPASTALQAPASVLLGSKVDLEAWAVAPARADRAPVSRLAGPGPLPPAVVVTGEQSLCHTAYESRSGSDDDLEHLVDCLDRVDAAHAACGSGPEDRVKLTIRHQDVRTWAAIVAMVQERYGDSSPTVTSSVVNCLAAPTSRVAISAWSRCSTGGTPDAADTARIDRADELLLTTGTGALDIFVGGKAADMYAVSPPGSIEQQTHLAMENQRKVLAAGGASFDDVVASTWYLTDVRDWPTVEEIAREHFGRELPVPAMVEVARLTAREGVRVEPDLWATVPRSRR